MIMAGLGLLMVASPSLRMAAGQIDTRAAQMCWGKFRRGNGPGTGSGGGAG
ncbi:MAG: hypothetical protein JWL68_6351 [Actinomycetia bacterium]|nr:hypothetical protein [Actinomycetes bacterium]